MHTSGGYLTQSAYTHHYVFDHKPGADVYWCTADIGWVTGHTYIVYGPLANRVTQVVYEGTPNSPTEHRHFEIIEQLGVTIYYTAPTLVRTFMKWGREIPDAHDLSSLRLLGSVGEPINPEAWRWFREVIGAGTTPVVDTWWQTETGAIMISPLPGITATKPGAAMTPLPGISRQDRRRRRQPRTRRRGLRRLAARGYLVLDEPWPAMLRGIWGDMDRYRDTYWSRYRDQGWYFAGDGARYDADGDLWVLGRVDDVMNISGHRISTAEVESALVGHSGVAEAAVVGATDATTGQAIVAFVILAAHTNTSRPRRHGRRPQGRGRPRDLTDRAPPRHQDRARTAQDPLRQDHAPPAARHRRRPRTRRHLHPRRPRRLRRHQKRLTAALESALGPATAPAGTYAGREQPQLAAPFRSELARYLRTETVGGTILLAAAAVALIWANSPAADAYFALRDWEIGPSALHLDLSVGELGRGRPARGVLLRRGPGTQT